MVTNYTPCDAVLRGCAYAWHTWAVTGLGWVAGDLAAVVVVMGVWLAMARVVEVMVTVVGCTAITIDKSTYLLQLLVDDIT
jgi:hypothetical protein